MNNLIISEKNSVALRLAIILADGKFKRERSSSVPIFRFTRDNDSYTIMGLRGHIVELDYPDELNNWHKTDPKDLIYATPHKRVLYQKMVEALISEASRADWIIIATDFDREGELIGLEAVELLNGGIDTGIKASEDLRSKLRIRRARFSSLGRNDVVRAFAELHDLDIRLAKSAECRQLIDLAWGATLTRLLSLAANQTGRNFLSVGRVQSPTLALIARRELEIENFVPKSYYNITAACLKLPDSKFEASHERNPFWDKEEAEKILSAIGGEKEAIVEKYSSEEREEYGPVPFSTTLFLVDATRIGYSGAEAMDIAERLYSEGFISYPRTDNTVYPRSLFIKGVLEKLLNTEFKKEVDEILAQEKITPTRGNVETTDHPPIYPVDAASRRKMSRKEWDIYELVVRRFLATVAPRSIVKNSSARLIIGKQPFVSEGKELVYEGWRRYYPYYRFYGSNMPALTEGERIPVEKISMREEKTKPLPRYTQGNLIKEMEKLGLGTKSTRHEIIQKLYDRKYVQGDTIRPTPVGLSVTLALEKRAPEVCDNKMTARLEQDMDKIAEGKIGMEEVVSESRDMLKTVAEEIDANREEIGRMIRDAILQQKRIGKCSVCGGDLRIIENSRGRFAGCSNYPECTVTYSLPSGYLIKPTDKSCEICSLPMIRLIAKGSKPVDVCINPSCESNRKTGAVGKCPSCGKELRIVRSQKGKRFVGCSGYPECSVTYPLPQSGEVAFSGKSCETCGAPLVEIRQNRGSWSTCINVTCPSKTRQK
ncbi:MAG: DNA topoisomerase I [Thermoplasmata archaeon]|uniref:DNA topoisomerase 1 n=1 Tax=Candidatus Sysuiplasma superficiale TaxID=2823368 RepID=A0A8J7YMA6_9ARCH|nr:DNA topoisomerase I [Candidatus Sysuiplasma superficiale]MBX8643793.1 DNA topoisomerase I [Candidatus Sysuiplasma superficiale]MCL4346617.1 DNA topoisomerase I [Candidatus Thermoplasmatota archaeon]